MYGLPYVFEAMVVGIDDLEYGQRVAAAVVLQDQVRFNLLKSSFLETTKIVSSGGIYP